MPQLADCLVLEHHVGAVVRVEHQRHHGRVAMIRFDELESPVEIGRGVGAGEGARTENRENEDDSRHGPMFQ